MRQGSMRQFHKKEFDSESFYDDKYTKTEKKSYNGRMNRNFLEKK